jgi:GLPGLI family protein
MEKKIIIAAILTLFASGAKAQETLDTAMLKCSYKYEYILDTVQNKGNNEIMIVEIGKNVRKFYSETSRLYDSAMMENTKGLADEAGKILPNAGRISIKTPSMKRSGQRAVIYFNYPQGKITTIDRIPLMYEYEENIETIDWQISAAETKDILGYNCKKATCTFRGRDYEVWYSPDIPINGGLWKFNGLPGLILLAYDTKNQFVFTCEGIEKISAPIVKGTDSEGKITKVKKNEFLKIRKKFYEDPLSVLNSFSSGDIKITDADGNSILQSLKRSMLYNSIELE